MNPLKTISNMVQGMVGREQVKSMSNFNLFRPERAEGESFEAYKKRRTLANKVGRAMEAPQDSRGDFKHIGRQRRKGVDRWLGQLPKFTKERRHKRVDPHTCLRVGRIPNSKQRRVWREGEPLIYRNPLALLNTLMTVGRDDKNRPIMHKDWALAQAAARQGWGRVLHQMVQRFDH